MHVLMKALAVLQVRFGLKVRSEETTVKTSENTEFVVLLALHLPPRPMGVAAYGSLGEL